VGRPVKVVLTRPQMFYLCYRPETVQRVRIGSTQDARLTAIDHTGTSTVGIYEDNMEPVTNITTAAYACPNVATHNRQVRLNVVNPGAMRGPGSTEGNFAIESAMDELAYKLGVDPIELRLRNFAEAQPATRLPWSSNALRACYSVGAERFGWSKRKPKPRSMRDGTSLIGYGMAGVSFDWYQMPCQVRISVRRDGTAHVSSAATDLGTGTYTVATQLSAELLGLGNDQVSVEIGDTALPVAAQSGGSGLAPSLSAAIMDCAGKVVAAFLDVVSHDGRSPLRGRKLSEVTVTKGRIHLNHNPAAGETYTDILSRHGLREVTADGSVKPTAHGASVAPAGAFAARFAEVHVDEDLGLLRVARFVSVIDAGRVLNEKTARSQILGATVMGIGMSMLEQTAFDTDTGRIANDTFGDYLIPVNADVPDLDVVFVGKPDTFNPVGVKGVGEVGIVGVAAAIANAVYHATGRRIRSLPITIDKLL
jgi:xanthine dehydrogenase YagR molybdenum-binding subunit